MIHSNMNMFNARIRSGQQVVVDLGNSVLDAVSGDVGAVLRKGMELTSRTIDTYTHLTNVIKRKSASIDPTIIGAIKKKRVAMHIISPGMGRASAVHPEVLSYYRAMGASPGGYTIPDIAFNGLTTDQCLAVSGLAVKAEDGTTSVTQYSLNDTSNPEFSIDDQILIRSNNLKIDKWIEKGSTIEECFGGNVVYF